MHIHAYTDFLSLALCRCRPTLGTTWNKVLLLGGLNFVFSALYTAALIAKNSDDQPDVSLVLFVVPLAITLFIFISWVRACLARASACMRERERGSTPVYVYMCVSIFLSVCV
jgi:Kef-type K+ transport system membrane component KefB